MSARAKALGAEILDLERELDAAFSKRNIDRAWLNDLTARIGARHAALRATHLEAHIETAALLSPEQIARYDALRGYGGMPSPAGPGGHGARH
jgi:Spy/CpxP family protein refolding chaperone